MSPGQPGSHPAAIAFVPATPLLVPALAAGAAAELAGLRAACDEALARVLARGPDHVLVVGSAGTPRSHPPGSVGSFAGFGVDLRVRFGPDAVEPPVDRGAELPLELAVGAWLLRRAGWQGCTSGQVGGVWLGGGAPGGGPVAGARRGLLVVGDGTARRSATAPGAFDPRAEAFDAGVACALATGSAAGLHDLDAGLGAELLAGGVPVWRSVGGLAGAWRGQLLHDSAPYGVAYLVASWSPG